MAADESKSLHAGARWALYYFAWVLLGVVFTAFVPLSELVGSMPRPVAGGVVDLVVSVYALGFLAPLAVLASRLAPFERRHWARALAVHVVAAAAFTLLHWWIVRLSVQHVFDWPQGTGLRGGRGRGFGARHEAQFLFQLLRHAGVAFTGYWLVVGLWHAADSSRKLRQREVQASQLEAQLATAKLQALKDQLHPHFLFNTLNTLSSLIYEDVEAADRVIRDLSALLRLAIDNAGAQTVTLADEVRFVDLYLEIMKTRYPDRLEVESRIHPESTAVEVPNLLLQPIVENSIKHGLESTGRVGRIRLESGVDGGRLWIEVSDNGPGLPSGAGAALSSGVGLRNTRDRLAQLYGADHRFEISNREGGGVLVRVEIPARRAEERGA